MTARVILLLAGLLVLGGCVRAGDLDTAATAAIGEIQQFNDTTAKAYLAAPCAIRIGAMIRNLAPIQQCAVFTLCGGTCPNLGQSQPSTVFMLSPGAGQ